MAIALDLVCGPDGPVPASRQRYRLLEHLGTGGQAEVYRGVRLSAGVRSNPVTVKVFRADPHHPLDEQLVAWDKGDAVLMDLNSRDVPGVCQRIDGFSGPRPTKVDHAPSDASSVPYQILTYLPGKTLIERLQDDRVASGGRPSDLDAAAVLMSLAQTLQHLHRPPNEATAVIHMDVKPANLVVLPDGQSRLIDFTASRYYDNAHLTTVAYSPSSGGPEAYRGADSVGFGYDVHGFGAVAYYLLTGWHPRQDIEGPLPAVADGAVRTTIRRHPILDISPRLASHVLAPLADNPADRPRTNELPGWIARLVELTAVLPPEARLARWPVVAGVTPTGGRSVGALPPAGSAGGVGSSAAVAPSNLGSPVAAPHSGSTQPSSAMGPGRRDSKGTSIMPPVANEQRPNIFSGSAQVPERSSSRAAVNPGPADRPPTPYPPFAPPPAALPVHPRAKGLTVLAFTWFFLCWMIWLVTVLFKGYSLIEPGWGLVLSIGAVFGVWWLSRLAEYLIRSTMERGPRRSTLLQNLVTSGFLIVFGAAFLSRTPLALSSIYEFLHSIVGGS